MFIQSLQVIRENLVVFFKKLSFVYAFLLYRNLRNSLGLYTSSCTYCYKNYAYSLYLKLLYFTQTLNQQVVDKKSKKKNQKKKVETEEESEEDTDDEIEDLAGDDGIITADEVPIIR